MGGGGGVGGRVLEGFETSLATASSAIILRARSNQIAPSQTSVQGLVLGPLLCAAPLQPAGRKAGERQRPGPPEPGSTSCCGLARGEGPAALFLPLPPWDRSLHGHPLGVDRWESRSRPGPRALLAGCSLGRIWLKVPTSLSDSQQSPPPFCPRSLGPKSNSFVNYLDFSALKWPFWTTLCLSAAEEALTGGCG